MTWKKPLIMSFCHSQNHDLGKVTGTEVMEAFGPSNIYCSLGPLGANVVMVDSQNHHPQRYTLWGTSWTVKPEGLLGWQIYTKMSWPPHHHSAICYGLGNGSSTFLNCHRISSKVGKFSNPRTCSGE